MSFFLTTARLGFRCWREDDLPLARGLWGDPEVVRHLGGPFTPEGRLVSEIALQREHGMQYWPMFLLESEEHVGCCGLRPYEPGVPELGFHLRQEFWGQGIAPEAARGVIQYAFGTQGVKALFAGHEPEHERSGSVLKKLGFEYQGMKVYPVNGLLEPAYLLRNKKP